MVHRKRKIAEKLKDKYKLVVLNNETFEEKASVTLNRISVFAAISIWVIVLILLTTALLVFTPLREYIPGYTDLSLRKEVTETAYMADSLDAVLLAQQAYLGNLRDIVNGTAGDSAFTETRTKGMDAPEVLHEVSLPAGHETKRTRPNPTH